MERESKGLGDTVARLTHAVGIRPCDGCEKRRAWLNEVVPYRLKSIQERTRSVLAAIQQTTPTPADSRPSPLSDNRQRVVLEARAWLGTPYVQRGRIKGVGCDCATLLIEVYRACGIFTSEKLDVFGQDWFYHATEDAYMLRVIRHAPKVAEGILTRSLQAQPGDIALVRTVNSRVYNHGGIVTGWPRVIHASRTVVQEVDASQDVLWSRRQVAVFDPFRSLDVLE